MALAEFGFYYRYLEFWHYLAYSINRKIASCLISHLTTLGRYALKPNRHLPIDQHRAHTKERANS